MIRKYEATDIEGIIEVWYEASLIAHPFLDSDFIEKEKRNIRELYIPNTKTWVFSKKNVVEGFISMMGNEVGAIFVRPEKHGQGIGKTLMDHVGQFHGSLEVDVFKDNKIGRKFYDKYGFKAVKEHIHEETKRSLLRMEFNK